MFSRNPFRRTDSRKTEPVTTMRLALAVVATLVATLFVGAPASWASVSLSYDFNTAGQVDANFNKYVASGSITQASSGGIGDSGAINLTTADGVYASKKAFSIGPVGSTYVFTAFMQSSGNSGYSGMGFTSAAPSAGTAGYDSHGVFRPNDALGLSVHGGGFEFNDAATSVSGDWVQTGTNSGVTAVTSSPIGDLLNNGSAVEWYKVVLTAERNSPTTFDMNLKVFPTDVNGNTLNTSGSASTSPSAEFNFNDRVATDLINAPVIYAYFNFSGTRVYNYDNFSVNLGGGASVIDPGFPVVLTSGVTATGGTLSFDGDVTSDGGEAITERGFVYSSSTEPTTSDTKVTQTGTTGTYSKDATSVADGTWYARAYATNSNGTSYGAEYQIVVSGGAGTGTVPDAVDEGGGGGGSDSISLYLSAPLVQGSGIDSVDELTEDFDGLAGSPTSVDVDCPTDLAIGTLSVAPSTAACLYRLPGIYGGASNTTSSPFFGGDGSTYFGTYGNSNAELTFTFPAGGVKYVGFWWSGGNRGNVVTFYNDATEVASFDTFALEELLGDAPPSSWPSGNGSVTSTGGTAYPKGHYFGNPRGYAENPPLSQSAGLAQGGVTYTQHRGVLYAYFNLFFTGDLTATSVKFSGNGFEFDNLTVSSSEVTPTDDLVLVLENIYEDDDGGGGGGGSPADPPTDITVTPGNGSATVGWTPASGGTGGEATSYTVSDESGEFTCTVDASATSCEVTGLTNGYPYVFSVVANNESGDSADSEPTPVVIPTAPYSGNTLTIYFTSISPKLKAFNQSLIEDFINDHNFKSVKCTGSTQGLETIVWLAKSRAVTACNFAKTVKPVKTSSAISKNKGARPPLRSVVLVGK